jgi:phospholipid/cholesterol/gamma-HCH transport system substrate-binding protein
MMGSAEVRVGFFVVLVAGLIGYMSLRVAEGPGALSGTRTHYFMSESANGLIKGSAVKMAGIKVGIIDDIELVDGQAKIIVRLKGDAPVRISSVARMRADGILGDKHVELTPGNIGDAELPRGEGFRIVESGGSLDDVVGEVSKVAKSVSELATILKNAASGAGDNSSPIGRIVLNIENLTKDLSEISGRNKEQINEIVDQVHRITGTLDGFINDDTPEGFKAAWQKAVDGLARLDETMKNVEEISAKINDGDGTLGKLVNDDTTVQNLNTTLEKAGDFFGGVSTMETSINFHAEYLGRSELTKSYLSLKLQPGLDRYYEIGIVDDPSGVSTTSKKSVEDASGNTTNTSTTTTNMNSFKFTALFAKNFYDFTVKGGFIESAGGLGLDYYLLKRRLRFSFEAFDFRDTNLRAFARYSLFKGAFLTAGGHKLLDSDNAEGFIGAGIFLTNDDIKSLVGMAF